MLFCSVSALCIEINMPCMVGHIHNLCINVLVPTNNAFNVMLGRTVGKERVSEACDAPACVQL